MIIAIEIDGVPLEDFLKEKVKEGYKECLSDLAHFKNKKIHQETGHGADLFSEIEKHLDNMTFIRFSERISRLFFYVPGEGHPTVNRKNKREIGR